MTDPEKLTEIKEALSDYASGRKSATLALSSVAQIAYTGDPIR